jgi:hypothetical protein
MPLDVELGKASQHRCGCCGKLSHVLRGFVSKDGDAHAVYMAGYTEKHAPEEGTVLVSIGDWTQGSTPADRTAVVVKVRRIGGRFQVMVVGPEGCPWDDVGVFGPIQTRAAALARPDIQEYFHVVDHVLETDDRFTRGFS